MQLPENLFGSTTFEFNNIEHSLVLVINAISFMALFSVILCSKSSDSSTSMLSQSINWCWVITGNFSSGKFYIIKKICEIININT